MPHSIPPSPNSAPHVTANIFMNTYGMMLVSAVCFAALWIHRCTAWSSFIAFNLTTETCNVSNICFQTFVETGRTSRTHVHLSRDFAEQLSCCMRDWQCDHRCHCLFVAPFAVPIVIHATDVKPQADIDLQGLTHIFDTLYFRYRQFGHYLSKLLQTFHFLSMAPFNQSLNVHGSPWHATCESHLCQLERFVMDSLPLVHPDSKLVCVANGLIPHPRDYETTFWTEEQWRNWRQRLSMKFNISFPACPKDMVVVLTRISYGVPRQLFAMEAISEALIENGITCYSVVELNHTGSLADQMHLFNNVGMMIATHGSYFKNMAYATPGSAFIEVAADPSLRKHQPWRAGLSMSGIVFKTSHGHTYEPSCRHSRKYDCGVVVNKTLLSTTIKEALIAQQYAGCNIVSAHRPCV